MRTTIIATSLNANQFYSTIERESDQGVEISIRGVPFPSAEVGLPESCLNLSSITSPEMSLKFTKALDLLRQPVENLLREDQPDCIVFDFFFPWTTDVAAKLGIPRLIFHGAGFFPLCVYHNLIKHKPYKRIESDSETFFVPELPDVVKMTRRQLPDYLREEPENPTSKRIENGTKTELESYGIVVNSFQELEPAYVEHYRSIIGRKVWHIGPVSLCNRDTKDKAQRGNNNNINMEKDCLDWLSNKEPNSVVYVCFGTVSLFSDDQLHELAIGLESSGQNFIWVVRSERKNEENEEWLPKGFAKRIEGKGLMIKGFATQVLILEHESVGGFLTHCGWNSLLEGVTAGVPMITWPISSEQFDNEKLVIDILKIGVEVGAQEWTKRTDFHKRPLTRGGNMVKGVKQVMVGEEAMEMRNRVSALSGEAKKAIEKGGCSYNDLNSLLEELGLNKRKRYAVVENE